MKNLAFATIKELKEKLKNKEITVEELLTFFKDRFEKFDGELGSALAIFDTKSILKETANYEGLLGGIPGILKDNICQKSRITSCASKILENFVSTYDATVTENLKKEGALLIGRANMDEFAMGSSSETSAFKLIKNPWNKECSPGGSSGGPAAAVAAGLIPWALGTDTGGSIRQPAALCGVVGIKPTYGSVSRSGVIALGSSLDQVGVLTRTVYDNALVYSVIAGNDPKDSTSANVEKKDYTKQLTGKLPENLKIGVVENAVNAEGIDKDIHNAVQAAISKLEKLGAKIKKVNLKSLEYATAAYIIINRSEAASNLARFDGVRYGFRAPEYKTLNEMYNKTRDDGFGDEVKLRILIGNYVLAADHVGDFCANAEKVRSWIKKEFQDAFQDVDLLVMPTTGGAAFKIGSLIDNPIEMILQDFFTVSINLAGVPAVSIPCGFTKNNLPIGFQLIGPHFAEEVLFQVGHAYQENTEWHKKHPEGY
ncbi:MAG: Glutamyl-tRNA(Gln) amidotransferase subunit A [candidate division TM6 bacterium GW2011_GWF2_32_72]|nr:MAG: Glutamyl-tRNA(Gln) amidotransferase subunit A [candidate division TM6 bacterium GW2011_GWF2_32_72]